MSGNLRSNVRADNSRVRVVVGDVLSRSVVFEVQLSHVGSDEGSAVGGDGRLETFGSQVGVVLRGISQFCASSRQTQTHLDVQGGEDGPFNSRVLGGALDQVWAEKGPGHGLRDTSLEPDGHGEGA